MTIIEIENDLCTSKYEDNENVSICRESASMAYNEFFENYLIKNKLCIFESNVTEDWLSRQEWCTNNGPNFAWFKRYFGKRKAPIADCNKKYYNAQSKNDMLVQDYIDYWIDYRNCNYSNKMPLLYLKDWHCAKTNSNLSFYKVPKYFASDWLNEYYNAHPHLDDDYMFVYMGPKGSWTPFHVDVFTSYSWSANIVGRKKWLLFPPGEENNLKDKNGDLIYDVTSAELNNIFEYDYTRRPKKSIEVIQEEGQIIFVPSGWHHQVWNLEDTISVNHNWLNGCNVWIVWNSLKTELAAVMKEIEDCKDMEDWNSHCQTMLKASFGMDYFQFYELLSFIAEKRLNSMMNNMPLKNFEEWHFGKNHCLFDLRQIKKVLENVINDADDKCITGILWKNNDAQFLINQINSIVNGQNN